VTVYTQIDENVADEIVQKINHNNAIVDIFAQHELLKIGNRLFKDLSLIKENLRRIVMVNWNNENVLQRENVIRIPAYGGPGAPDDVLQRLAVLLDAEMTAADRPEDLRELCLRINMVMEAIAQ